MGKGKGQGFWLCWKSRGCGRGPVPRVDGLHLCGHGLKGKGGGRWAWGRDPAAAQEWVLHLHTHAASPRRGPPPPTHPPTPPLLLLLCIGLWSRREAAQDGPALPRRLPGAVGAAAQERQVGGCRRGAVVCRGAGGRPGRMCGLCHGKRGGGRGSCATHCTSTRCLGVAAWGARARGLCHEGACRGGCARGPGWAFAGGRAAAAAVSSGISTVVPVMGCSGAGGAGSGRRAGRGQEGGWWGRRVWMWIGSAPEGPAGARRPAAPSPVAAQRPPGLRPAAHAQARPRPQHLPLWFARVRGPGCCLRLVPAPAHCSLPPQIGRAHV